MQFNPGMTVKAQSRSEYFDLFFSGDSEIALV